MLPIPPDIKDYLSYNPDTGKVVWSKKTYPKARVKVGDEAGCVVKSGYRQLYFNGVPYRAHRVAWFLYYGEDPCDLQVDHINGDKLDNRLVNLRLATHQQNQQNRKPLGVYLNQGKWKASLSLSSKDIYIGHYECPLMAGLAYQDVKSILHPRSIVC